MNQKAKLKRIYLPLLLLTVLVSVTFRIAAVLADFDVSTGYFGSKALINTASVAVVIGCILLFTYAFVGAKGEKLIATFTTPETYVPSGAIVTALIFFAVSTYARIKNFDFSFRGQLSAKAIIAHVAKNLPEFISAALIPLALAAAVYFILNAANEKRASVARAGFGIAAVIFFALYTCFLYFDKTLTINAPNKIVDQMAFLFAALFLLYEIRISLGRECWHLYMAFGFIAAALSAYSSIPSIVLYLTGGGAVSHSIEENAVSLCIFIFAFSRVLLAAKLEPDRESEFVLAMRDGARARDKYIKDKEEIERRAYLELYNRLKEIEELPDDVNESEMFVTEEDTGTESEVVPEAESEGEEESESEDTANPASEEAEPEATEAEQKSEEAATEIGTEAESISEEETVSSLPADASDGSSTDEFAEIPEGGIPELEEITINEENDPSDDGSFGG
ncbi:MAG: hypothetical protein IJD79_03545 [Clostridia bacterium]|nr:hypothetical protein [Clostridia bacterium]